jgi:hypothetical protein
MKQVVQPVSGGQVQVLDVPAPVIGPAQVLVRTVASVIFPGTERALTALTRSTLLTRAAVRAVRGPAGRRSFSRLFRGRADLPTEAMLRSIRTTLQAAGRREDLMTFGRHAESPYLPRLLYIACPYSYASSKRHRGWRKPSRPGRLTDGQRARVGATSPS